MSTDPEDRILATSRALFLSHGFRSVRVDDIVHELGMSKKTFYLYFENKEQLVRTIVLGNFEALEQSGMAIFESDLTVAEKVAQLFSILLEQFSKVHPDAPRDLLRLYPGVLDELAARRRKLLERYEQVIEEGQRRGELGTSLLAPALTKTIITIIEAVGHPAHLARAGIGPADMIELVQGIVLVQREPDSGLRWSWNRAGGGGPPPAPGAASIPPAPAPARLRHPLRARCARLCEGPGARLPAPPPAGRRCPPGSRGRLST